MITVDERPVRNTSGPITDSNPQPQRLVGPLDGYGAMVASRPERIWARDFTYGIPSGFYQATTATDVDLTASVGFVEDR